MRTHPYRHLFAYGLLAVLGYVTYRIAGTIDSEEYWAVMLLAIGYGAALSWASEGR